MVRILQLHEDAVFLQAMSSYCSRLTDVLYEGARDYLELLQFFDRGKPDLLLLDLNLQPQGVLEALAGVRTRWPEEDIKVLLLAAETTPEHVLADAAGLGADYCMQLPVELFVLETRIRQLVGDRGIQGDIAPQRLKPLTRRQVQEKCTIYFENLGIPPHYKGYRYLIEGIWLASLQPAWLKSVTQHLYPAIGEHFEVNSSQVERAMRYALDVTWEKGNMEQLYQFFPFVREDRGKPTNTDFIATMVDFIKLGLDKVG